MMESVTHLGLGGGHARFLFHDHSLTLDALKVKHNHFTVRDDGKGAFHIAWADDVKADVRIFGLGACSETADRCGGVFKLASVDTQLARLKGTAYSTFPVMWARHRYGCAAFVLASSFPYEVRTLRDGVTFEPLTDNEGEGTDLVIIEGTPHEISRRLARLTGMPAMPPLWALGYHQSRWSYKTEAEVLQIADKLRQHQLPADAIHLDIHYMHDYRVFTWHPERFPDPVRLHKTLAERKIHTVAIVDPGVGESPDDETYKEMLARGYFLSGETGQPYVGKVWPGRSLFPDFLRKEVRDFWALRHRALLEAGVAGIWNDMNEPTLHNTRYIEPTTTKLRHADTTHTRVRNLYANHMAQAAFEAQNAVRPGKRPFVLTRSGFLGVQKYAALWTGDNFSHWQQLRANLHMVLNLGLSGVPLTGADVGGFGSMRGPLGLFKLRRPPRELFIRWMELGSFMPFFRGHATKFSPRQEPWSFGAGTLGLAKQQLERRYRLLPHYYAIMREAAETGAPIIRPHWYHGDETSDDDTFWLGQDIFVAPVLDAKQRSRKVVLPRGTFVDANDFTERSGDVTIDAPLGTIPSFVRSNAIVFTCEGAQHAHEALTGRIYADVYATQETIERSARLVVDDGETDPKADDYRSFDAKARFDGRTLRFDWTRKDGAHMPRIVVRVRGTFANVLVDGRPAEWRVLGRGPHGMPWTEIPCDTPPETVQLLKE